MKAAIFGALGALLAILPVSLVKTLLFMSGHCGLISPRTPQFLFPISRCGFIFVLQPNSIYFWIYILSVLLGGSLLGALVVAVLMRRAAVNPTSPISRRPSSTFWPAFSAGILLVVLFVFLSLYPGQ